MSEEEKEAIETLIEIQEFSNLSSNLDTKIKQLNAIDTVLNYIDKLEKELLHWKGQYHLLSRKVDYISKDKIREKIKELEEDREENLQAIQELKILLEEN